MAAGVVSQVIHAPGRLTVTPTDTLSDTSKSFPYGGTEIGKANAVSLTPIGAPPFQVEYESLGEVGEVLEGDNRWVFAMFLRAWDRDAVQQFLPLGYTVGAQTQHALWSVPGTKVPGSARIGKALKILTEEKGVILRDTPEDYFPVYMAAAKATLEKNAADNAFFKKVWDSQKAFAVIAVPFWAGAQTSNAKLGMAFANSLKK